MYATADEQLVSSLWQLDGYITTLRWPVTVKGNYSDIDVIGVNADGMIRFAECKATNGPRTVYVVKDTWAKNFVTDWLEKEWAGSLDNIGRIWEEDERPKWLPLLGEVKDFSFWFCANLWFPNNGSRLAAEEDFTKFVKTKMPKKFKGRVTGKIMSTLEVWIEVVKGVRKDIVKDEYGKRYGDPILDVVREIIRFSYPKAVDAGHGVSSQIAAETEKVLKEALWGKR
jgi:hypothetical protein